MLAATALCALLAVVFAAAALGQYRVAHRPQATVRAFFAAVSAGDAARALAFAETRPSGPYLTDQVLGEQLAVARLSNVTVGNTDIHGASATVAVHYRLGFAAGPREVDDTAELDRHGSSWLLARVSSAVRVSADSTATDRLSFAGRPLPVEPVDLLPGALPVLAVPASLTLLTQPSARLADSDTFAALRVGVSNTARQQVDAALRSALQACLSGTPVDVRCPMPDVERPVPGTLRGTADLRASPQTAETVELNEQVSGRIQVTEHVTVRGSWQVWDFDNQVVPKSGTIEVPVAAVVSVADPSKIYWTSS
jgi:hypothetical protein